MGGGYWIGFIRDKCQYKGMEYRNTPLNLRDTYTGELFINKINMNLKLYAIELLTEYRLKYFLTRSKTSHIS